MYDTSLTRERKNFLYWYVRTFTYTYDFWSSYVCMCVYYFSRKYTWFCCFFYHILYFFFLRYIIINTQLIGHAYWYLFYISITLISRVYINRVSLRGHEKKTIRLLKQEMCDFFFIHHVCVCRLVYFQYLCSSTLIFCAYIKK